ncbi:hypothetical protein D6789_02400 [Candidatus Woesearchaeota archaeon]|nr:MAG: hypothetical protein D6789_02400 [Candidatus Woesearchaeota archaeon]
MRPEDIEREMSKAFYAQGLPRGEINVVEKETGFLCRYYAPRQKLEYIFMVNPLARVSSKASILSSVPGMGRRMCRAREALCKKLGIQEIILEYVVPRAAGFWAREGYELRRVRDHFEGWKELD